MGDISKHISRHETACRCGCGFATADFGLINAIEETCAHFQFQNKHARRVVVHIKSFCRCADHDLSVQRETKGEHWRPSGKPSEHLRGWAADFWLEYELNWIDDKTKLRARRVIPADEVADYLELKFPGSCGIGRYKNRTHLDMRPNPVRWDNR